MKKIHVLVGLALAGAFSAAQALPVDFSGYARGGYGVNTNGGRQTCFSLKGTRNVDTHYRLGDECDYTLELNLNATLAKNTDGSEWHVNFMLKNWKKWNMTSGMGGQGPSVDFAQAYAYGQNMPMLAGGTIWAGRRYYNRFQLGINDHFLSNDDGDGFGVDDMNLGGGVKLTLGVMTNELNSTGANNDFMQKYIAKVSDIPTFAGSKLQIRGKYQAQSKTEDRSTTPSTQIAKRKNGYQLVFIHETPNVLNGTFTAGLRFDRRVGGNDDGGQWHAGNGKSTQVFAQQSGGFGKTSYDVLSEYKITKYDETNGAGMAGVKDKWFSIGGRLDTQISGPMRGIAELGYDTVKRSGAAAAADNSTFNFTHLTLALAFNSGAESWSRPTVRLYYTYGKWNDAYKKAGQPTWEGDSNANTVWGGKSNGSAVGAQWEAWW